VKWIVSKAKYISRGCLTVSAAGLIILMSMTAAAHAEDDFGYWSAYDISAPLTEKFRVYYAPQLRWREDWNDFYYHEHRWGLTQALNPNLKSDYSYLFTRMEPRTGPYFNENRGTVDLTPSYPWGDYVFSLRGRVELRQVEGSSADLEWRFRIKPGISTNVEALGRDLKLYADYEFFYEDKKSEWNQNRATGGVQIPLGDLRNAKVSFDVFYLFKTNRTVREDWTSEQILGTKLSLKF
jgi:hypothetical protein